MRSSHLIKQVFKKRKSHTAEEQQRLSKLEATLRKIQSNEPVQIRQLERWLTKEEFAHLDALWEEQKSFREELKDKPSELRRYEEMLKKATFYANKAEGFRRKGNKKAVASNSAKCESYCEDGLEVLQEIVAADASLQIWFDRALDFGFGSQIDAHLGNLPRVVTSRSIEKQSSDSRIMTKQQVKISVVEDAIDALKYEYNSVDNTDTEKSNKSKLASFLNNI